MNAQSKQVEFLHERAELIEKIDERATKMELDFTPIAPVAVRVGAESQPRGDVVGGVDLHFLRRLDATLQELADRRDREAAVESSHRRPDNA